MWKRNNYLFIALMLCGLLSFAIVYVMTPGKISSDESPSSGTEADYVSKQVEGVVQVIQHFQTCNHTVVLEEYKMAFTDANLAELQAKYPASDGWKTKSSNGLLIFQMDLEGMCPEDAAKRHLGVAGEYLAIFKGPVGLNGGLEKVTNIKVNSLPDEWREKVHRGLLDFASEAELLEALDSLDEYE